jgi:hypothetical protein
MAVEDFTKNLKTERMTDMALAYKKSCTLVTAVELGLFSAISGGADTLSAIADATGLEQEKADRLLTVCKAIELVREVDGRYVNMSDVERYLVKDKRTYFGEYLNYIATRDYDAWPSLTENLTTVAEPEEAQDGDDRTYLSVMDDPAYAREFTEAGYEASLPLGYKLAKEFDFSRHRRWLDIAGGSGCYSIPACEKFPELTSTVLDLPNVLPVTIEYVAKHGLSERIDTTTGNFLEPGMPTGYDLVSFITPLQGYMPDKVITALRYARECLEPGGTILVIDYMLNEAKTGPTDPAYVNLFGVRKGKYLNRVNTGSEWADFMRQAGFVDPEPGWFTPHQLGMIVARNP